MTIFQITYNSSTICWTEASTYKRSGCQKKQWCKKCLLWLYSEYKWIITICLVHIADTGFVWETHNGKNAEHWKFIKLERVVGCFDFFQQNNSVKRFDPLKVVKMTIKKHASSHPIPARPQISFSDPQLYKAFCWTPSFFPDRQYNHDQEWETFANCTHLHYAIQRRFLERLSEASKRNWN